MRLGRILMLPSWLILALSAACAPLSIPFTVAPTVTPMPEPSPTFTSTPTPTSTPKPTPTPTPTSTPVPTLDSDAVVDTIAEGRFRLEAAGVEPLCLHWEDTDGDGGSEWIGLSLRPTDPPELRAFILDGEAWYDLEALEKEKHGLGEYPTCEMNIRDINNDGLIEVLIWGHAEDSIDLLHIFVWDGASYALLASFEGEVGIRLENTDGDLAEEIVVGYEASGDLVWETVYTWDGANYGWTWSRYAWFYLDRPHAYPTDTPEHTVISFYLAVDDRDLPGAYGLLSPGAQATRSYGVWLDDFATTISTEVGSVQEIDRSGNTAVVAAQVRAYDNVDGRVVATLWDVTWTAVRVEGKWRLESLTTEELERWETPYYR